MALQALAAGERGAQLLDDSGLVLGEAVGVVPVDGGEGRVKKLVFDAVYHDRPVLAVDQVQKVAVVQAERGVLGNERCLYLELDDSHGLLDLLGEACLGLGKPGVALQGEGGAGVVRVGVGGEGGQGAQVDAVSVLQNGQVAVAGADAHDVGHAAGAAGSGAHPQDVVVAPLHIDVGVGEELVHDELGRRPAVVHVADEVQLVDDEVLDESAQHLQEGRALAGGDEAFDDRLAIGLPGRRTAPGDEFLGDGEVVRQKRAHLVDGAVAGGPTGDFGQARGGFVKPCVGIFDVLQGVSAMFGRIAGECEQRGFLVVVQRAAENVLDERAHRA